MAALLLVGAGLFWWQGRAETERGAPVPSLALASAAPQGLPDATGAGLQGLDPPAATEATREQRRFDRVDRDRDGKVTRNEMLALRADAFRKLDADHNNLLSFEEWAVRTSNRFAAADGNGDAMLTRAEFAATKPKRAVQPQCRCAPVHPIRADAARGRAGAAQPARNTPRHPAPEPVSDDDASEGDEPPL